MRKARLEYPKSFKTLRIIAWLIVPLYMLLGCERTFQWGFGAIPSLSDVLVMTFGGLFIFVFITPLKRALLPIAQGGLKKRIKAGTVWLIVLAIIFLLVSDHQKTGRKNYLEWIFERFIARPVPQNVEIIDGAFFGFQDHTGWLIFKTNRDSFRKLVETYKSVPQDNMLLNNCFPQDVINPVFYYRMNSKDNYCDTTFLIWDEDNLKCYVDINPNTKPSSGKESLAHFYSRWTEPTPEIREAFIKRQIEERKRLKKLSPEELVKEKPDITLAEAVEMNNLELVKHLLQIDSSSNGIEHATGLLLRAIRKRNYEMAELFIKNGAEVTCRALLDASTAYKKEIVKLLLENGADLDCVVANYMTKLGSKDVAISATPLMYAVLHNNVELVELLIEYGADVNVVSKKIEYAFSSRSIEITALGIARKKGLTRIEKILLEARATQ